MVANLIGAPFYGYLAERCEQHLTGQAIGDDEGWAGVVKDIPRSLWRELQKIGYYLPRALGLLILGLIPVVNLVAVVLWFVFNSWMMALQYVDYPADNHKIRFSGAKTDAGRAPAVSLGFRAADSAGGHGANIELVCGVRQRCAVLTALWVREQGSARF